MNKCIASKLLIISIFVAATVYAEGPETRESLTSSGIGIQRGGISEGRLVYNSHDPLLTSGTRAKPANTRDASKSTVTESRTPNTDFWFYDVDVQLFSDLDRDGYFHGIDLLFDADTNFSAADVYAVVYLSYEYGPWNEYAETEDFTLFGTSSSDEYIIETELVAGYPTGSYDILIELYDAWDSTLLAFIGPDEAVDLAMLPLEDAERDAPSGGATQVVVNSGGGGSLSWVLLFVLLAVRMTFRPHAARLSK
ncbi:MAG TPA: choice-of-anchor H family protein [Woeseiaceae bacterium]